MKPKLSGGIITSTLITRNATSLYPPLSSTYIRITLPIRPLIPYLRIMDLVAGVRKEGSRYVLIPICPLPPSQADTTS